MFSIKFVGLMWGLQFKQVGQKVIFESGVKEVR